MASIDLGNQNNHYLPNKSEKGSEVKKMKKMKKIAVMFLLLVSLFCVGTLYAIPVTFNFDALSLLQGSNAIETYMEGLYGSDITVTTAVVGGLGGNNYIMNLAPSGYFSIAFATPIQSLSFDWGVFYPTTGSDFIAKADGVQIFSANYNQWLAKGSSGNILLASPATTFTFSDHGMFDIGIDNLVVDNGMSPIPEPGSMMLLGSGLVGLVGYGKVRFGKK